MPVGTNQFECRGPAHYYVCSSNGFRGCCAHDPCSVGSCEDNKDDTSSSETASLPPVTIDASLVTFLTAIKKSSSSDPAAIDPTTNPTKKLTAEPTAELTTKPTREPTTKPTTRQTTGSSVESTAESTAEPTTTQVTGRVSGDSSESDSSFNVALIGGIVGGILALILAALFIFFLCRRRRKIRKRSPQYDSIQDKTAELDTPNESYPIAGYRGTSANGNTPSITLNDPNQPGKASAATSTTGGDPAVLLASTPLLPNELPASEPSQALELPSTAYKPPLPELSQNPTRELINQQNALQNSFIQPTTQNMNRPLLTTTPEGAVLRSNLNASTRSKGPKGADPRHHVMSFMSYENRSDTRLDDRLNNSSSTSVDQVPVAKPAASASLGHAD